MRVLQLATSTDGGAGIAARRLNDALNAIGVDSVLLTGSSDKHPKKTSELVVKKSFIIRNFSKVVTVLQNRLLQKGNFLMTPFSLETIAIESILNLKPDVIHLHTFYNFLNTETISKICNSGIPLFLSLHDERFYTGGCHHAMGCAGFEAECLHCPETKSFFQEITVRAQDKLAVAFNQQQDPTVIAPSEWIASRARRSKILKNADVVKISNPLGLEFIASSEGIRESRDPTSPFLVTFVAQDLQNPFKGLDTLLECIKKYEKDFRNQNIQFIFVGKGPNIDIGDLKARQHEKIDSTKMIDIYRDSDLLIVPSLVDNSPNVIFEALACGTPFVGSNQAGIPELSKKFGMDSFKFGDSESMFKAILDQKEKDWDSIKIRESALELVHPEVVAKQVAQLYRLKSTVSD